MSRRSDPLVYSSRHGRVCPHCGLPQARCACRRSPRVAAGDGVVRVRRETQRRGGKTVTTISGVALPAEELRQLAGELKRLCGSGGTAKDGTIEIQGDHCDAVLAELRRRGWEAKRAGG